MRGPFLPLYGTGAIMMLLVSMPYQDNMFLVFLVGCVGATVLEYVTGVAMEALFKVRYWDYSGQKFQFQGHICLSSSLAWGGLTILMTEVLHKPVEKLAFALPRQILVMLVLVLTAYIGADFALSFKAALDLRDVLMKMEKAKEELEHIQRRLDVVIALTNEELSQKKEEVLMELKIKHARLAGEMEQIGRLRDVFQRELLRSHPSMSSVRFKGALEELKKRLDEKRKGNESDN